VSHIADDEEYADKLAAKLIEEAQEVDESTSQMTSKNSLTCWNWSARCSKRVSQSRGAVEDLRHEKRAERGGFEERIVLERVEDGRVTRRRVGTDYSSSAANVFSAQVTAYSDPCSR
jgi:predicted house-cleaning noncanonical NTP pyrophosphatase (MazG superfamily)